MPIAMQEITPEAKEQAVPTPEDTAIGSHVRDWLVHQFADIDRKFRWAVEPEPESEHE